MRTTLTLESDVASLLAEEVRRQGKPLKQVINEALRRGLRPPSSGSKRFRVKPHATTLRSGVDPACFNRLAEELEDEGIEAKLTQAADGK